MERKIILKNTDTGQELTLPVTPERYPMAAGRAVERLDMAVTGQVALPGLQGLFSETVEALLPAQLYPFCVSEAVADPDYYLEQLTAWSRDANVCRYIVVGTEINRPVLLGEISYREEDGSNDVYANIPLYEYRYLEEAQVETDTENNGRAVEGASQPETAKNYTVVKGDSLWEICRKNYGDGALAYKLATANGIKNPNLIYPGQVLELPDATVLAGMQPTAAKSTAVKKTSVTTSKAETPAQAIGDIRANIGLAPLAQTKMNELIQKYGDVRNE